MASVKRFRTVVLGGGVMGACAALASARGQRMPSVALVDAHEPGHRHGSSHGDGRVARLTYPESVYLELAERSLESWQQIERSTEARLLEVTGSWECARPDNPALQELQHGLAAADVTFERLSRRESLRRFPQIAVPEGHAVIYQPDGRIIRADSAVRSIRRLAETHGTKIFDRCRIQAVEPGRNGRLRLLAEGLIFEADSLILAAGGWARPILKGLGLDLPLEVSRETLAYFTARPGSPDHSFRSLPTVIDYDGGRIFYALPQIETPGIKAGCHRSGAPSLPEQDETPDPRLLNEISEFVERRFPFIDPTPASTTTCLYTNSPDYHFVIDRHPDLPQVVIGTGFSGHGFKFAPEVGKMLAQLAAPQSSIEIPEPFRIARLSASALTRRTCA